MLTFKVKDTELPVPLDVFEAACADDATCTLWDKSLLDTKTPEELLALRLTLAQERLNNIQAQYTCFTYSNAVFIVGTHTPIQLLMRHYAGTLHPTYHPHPTHHQVAEMPMAERIEGTIVLGPTVYKPDLYSYLHDHMKMDDHAIQQQININTISHVFFLREVTPALRHGKLQGAPNSLHTLIAKLLKSKL